MVGPGSLLVTLVSLIDLIPHPPPPATRGPGAPRFYPDRLFLKALVIMIVRHLHTAHELLAVLAEPTAELQALRGQLTRDGRFPCRRTWERRLAALPAALPAQIGCLGRELVAQVQPWLAYGRAATHGDRSLQRCRRLLAGLPHRGLSHPRRRRRGRRRRGNVPAELLPPSAGQPAPRVLR